MKLAVHGGLHPLPGIGRGRGPARPHAGRVLSTLVVLVVFAVLVATLFVPTSERRALRALPEKQRLALLSRTVDELRQFCGESRPAALEDHCRELASFAAQFDECNGECEALVHHQLAPAPTR
jgi:hypothetical protein